MVRERIEAEWTHTFRHDGSYTSGRGASRTASHIHLITLYWCSAELAPHPRVSPQGGVWNEDRALCEQMERSPV